MKLCVRSGVVVVFLAASLAAFSGGSAAAGEDKPLALTDLVARAKAMAEELQKAQRARNENLVNQLKAAHEKERLGWVGKRAEGICTFRSLRMTKYIEGSGPGTDLRNHKMVDKSFISASVGGDWAVAVEPKSEDDPLLQKMKRGDSVKISGVLRLNSPKESSVFDIVKAEFSEYKPAPAQPNRAKRGK